MILFKVLENEDSYRDLEFIISKVNFYSPCSCTSLFSSNSVLSLILRINYVAWMKLSSSSFAFPVRRFF